MSVAVKSKSSPPFESWPRWRQQLSEIPKDELCGSQKDLLRSMELLDYIVDTFDGKHPVPMPTAANPDAPLAIFLPFLEIVHLPIKDRAIFPLLQLEVSKLLTSFLIKMGFYMENLAANSYPPDVSESDLEEMKNIKPSKSPLALAIYKLASAGSYEAGQFVLSPEGYRSTYLYMANVAFDAKNLLTNSKNTAENEKEMKRLQDTYKTQLTLADLIEIGDIMYAELILKAAEYSATSSEFGIISDPQLVDRAVGAFENFLSTLEKKSSESSSGNFWFRSSKIYSMMGPTPKVSTLEETESTNIRVKKIMQRNLEVARKCSPPDPLREAWACFDLGLASIAPDGWYYKDLKGLMERGNECMAICKAWVPPYFRKILIEGVELTETMLSGAERMFPNDYQTIQLGNEVIGAIDPSEFDKIDLSDPSPARRCSACEEESRTMSACARCKKVFYCNAACQKKHWKVHKRVCKSG